MPNGSAEPGRARRTRRFGVAALLASFVALGGSACLGDDQVRPPDTLVPPAVDQAIEQQLRDRADDVRQREMADFLAGVDTSDRAFRRAQTRLFLNLQELPLQRYDLVPTSIELLPDGQVLASVNIVMQLKGYDRVPVRTPAHFTYAEDSAGEWLLVSDHDRAWEIDNDVDPQPWELTRIEAEERDGVLGIFDRRSIDDAYRVMAAVAAGIDDVAARIPLRWDRTVVLYALSDTTMMASLDDLPGGDPERLEGVAFGVMGAPGSGKLASVRFMLHPRMIGEDDAQRDRLIRHELTHVALGARDDRVPTWLAEGLAEYVSVQAVPLGQREIARQALEASQRGLTRLPKDVAFNGPRSGANYGVAWFACEYIADQFGEEALWRLFDAMRKGNGTPEGKQDPVLEAVLGMDSAELARHAGRLVVKTFG